MCTRVCIASHIACGGDFWHVGGDLFTHALDDNFDRMFRNAHVHGYLVTPPPPLESCMPGSFESFLRPMQGHGIKKNRSSVLNSIICSFRCGNYSASFSAGEFIPFHSRVEIIPPHVQQGNSFQGGT